MSKGGRSKTFTSEDFSEALTCFLAALVGFAMMVRSVISFSGSLWFHLNIIIVVLSTGKIKREHHTGEGRFKRKSSPGSRLHERLTVMMLLIFLLSLIGIMKMEYLAGSFPPRE
jgi:hypothetical protein